ncbi:MAG: hypothetical protein ABH825_02860 [Candidatus Omnitrophota bacterium]
MNNEVNILHYVDLFKKSWKGTFFLVAISAILTMIFSMFLPSTYASSAKLILKSGGSSAGSYAGGLGKFLGISDLGGKDSSDMIVAIIKSRRMAKDIEDQFKLSAKPKFWWEISTTLEPGSLVVDVRGSDPALTEKIADFTIHNLDKINTELEITTEKPMVKILDKPSYGVREPKNTLRKMLIAGLLTLLAISFFNFFLDYINRLKVAGANAA